MIKGLIARSSIASRLFAVTLVFVLVLSGLALIGLWLDANQRVEQNARQHTQAVASSVADDPYVVAAVQKADPSATLQPYAVRMMKDSKVDFITIMSPAGIRYTHRDPAEIGKKYIGTIAPALRGHPLTETYTGTLGPSVRSVYPVFGADGSVVALVSAGVTVGSVAATVNSQLPFVVGAALVLLMLGAVGAIMLRRYLNRVTHGMGPTELERMFSYYEAVLYSVREGLLLVDASGTVTLYNEPAAQLLNLPETEAHEGRRSIPVCELPVPESLRELLASGERVHDLVQLTDDRVLVINQEPAQAPGRPRRLPSRMGTVTTIRDHTELQQLAGELQTMRTLADSLRSQTHEFSNKLHTMVSLIELDRTEEALDFATEELQVNQLLADRVVGAIDEPVLAALVLGKTAQAQERGVQLRLNVESADIHPAVNPADLVTIVGNLLDNAIDAAAESAQPWVALDLATLTAGDERMLVITVADGGAGVPPEQVNAIFERGYSTKQSAHNRGYGLALVAQAVRRRGGSIRHSPGDPGAVFTVTLPMPGVLTSSAIAAPTTEATASDD
ncbi:sensor histidine kinase [Humibacter sp.]|uniref:sensor histidine kinase n=1 Tax=Humibacter sp. TaxID=1940291 RepID=UPI003F7CF158